jgi:hypothetical protein
VWKKILGLERESRGKTRDGEITRPERGKEEAASVRLSTVLHFNVRKLLCAGNGRRHQIRADVAALALMVQVRVFEDMLLEDALGEAPL